MDIFILKFFNFEDIMDSQIISYIASAFGAGMEFGRMIWAIKENIIASREIDNLEEYLGYYFGHEIESEGRGLR